MVHANVPIAASRLLPWGQTLLPGMRRYVYTSGLLTSITAELGTLTTWAIIPFQTDPAQKFETHSLKT